MFRKVIIISHCISTAKSRGRLKCFWEILILIQMVAYIDLRWPKATAATRPTALSSLSSLSSPLQQNFRFFKIHLLHSQLKKIIIIPSSLPKPLQSYYQSQ